MKLGEFFLKLDRYGTPISFNYKGKVSHKTLFGGIMTFLSILILLIFGIEKTIFIARK
jgi:hypothetical protein